MNYNQQAPLQNQADEMAKYGRYGDTMLVHMNPYEVEGIASLSPTGKLTTNPVTGQPEAFLPFLAPLLGSMIGKAALAKAGGLLAGKAALAGAIGSGLATTAVTGDIKKGLLSGITGFGLGKALGAASDALNPQIGETATALTDATKTATEAGVDLAKVGADVTLDSPLNQLADLEAANLAKTAADQSVTDLTTQLSNLRGEQTVADSLTAPFRQPKAFGSALMQPSTLAAIGVGEGQKAQMDSLEDAMERNRRFEREKEEEGRRAEAMIEDAYSTLESSYPGYQIPRGISAGGIVSLDPSRAQKTVDGVYSLANGGPTPSMPMPPKPDLQSRKEITESLIGSTNPYGVGRTYETMVTQSAQPNLDGGMNIFRSVMEEVGLPPETQKEAKAIFEYDLRQSGLSKAMEHFLDRYGEGKLSADKVNLGGADPRTYDMTVATEQFMTNRGDTVGRMPVSMNLIREGDTSEGISDAEALRRFKQMSSGGEVAGYRMGRKIKKEAQEQANAIADQVAFDTAMGNINLGSYGNFGVSGGPAGRPGAAARQLGLRGTQVITPSELEGYRPGIDPEIAYFRDPLPEPKADTTAGTGETRADAGQLGSDLYNAIFGSGLGTGVAAPVIDPFSGKMPSEMAMEGIGAEPSMMIGSTEGAGIPSIGAAARAEATPMPDTKPLTPKEIRMGRGMEGDIAIPEITIPQTINIPSVPAAAVVPPVVPAAIAPISTPPAVSVGRPDVMDLPPPPPMQTKRNTEQMVGIPMAPIRPSSIRIPDIPALQEPMIPIGVKTLDREESPNIPPPPAPVVRPPRPTMTLAEAARPRTDQPIDLTNVNTAGAANISDIGGFFGQAESGISQLPPIATPPVMSPIQMPREEMALPPIPEGKQVPGGLADLIRSAGVPKPVDTPIIPSEVPPLLAPKDRERIRIPRFAGPPGFQEGGEVTAMADTMEANGQSVIQDAAMAIAGRLPEEQAEMAINRFIKEFGVEAFEVLRDRVLKDIVPDAQTEGEIVGRGGGMDDMIPGMIGDQQPVAVSPGEYIVPADVVSGLGDGSTDAGVEELDQMLDRVRMERTGMTQQPRPMNTGGALPA